MSKKKIILVINCPDKAGIIASVSTFLFKNKFNISKRTGCKKKVIPTKFRKKRRYSS